jgi:hypothetical protein
MDMDFLILQIKWIVLKISTNHKSMELIPFSCELRQFHGEFKRVPDSIILGIYSEGRQRYCNSMMGSRERHNLKWSPLIVNYISTVVQFQNISLK